MSLLQAIILALVQGLTEFLPISSSGHLVLVSWIIGWDDQGFMFDALVHGGSLVAVLWYFRRDWISLYFGVLSGGKAVIGGEGEINARKFTLLLAVATIPLVFVGLFFRSNLENLFRSPEAVGILLLITGAVLATAHIGRRGKRRFSGVALLDAVIIGIAQAVAILPGVSRSGATIAAGVWLNFERRTAARLSFMLATPVLVGALLFPFIDRPAVDGDEEWFILSVGVLVSAAASLAAIYILMRVVERLGLAVFAAYAFALGTAVLVARSVGL